MDAWLGENPMTCPGALHFEETANVISYGIQTNSTPLAKRGNFEDPTFKFQVPLQLAAEREIARFLIGGKHFTQIMLYAQILFSFKLLCILKVKKKLPSLK